MQQRGVEFSQLFRGHNHLRGALLEKMPPMQISRMSNQNGQSPDENGGGNIELFENGLDDVESPKLAPLADSVIIFYLLFFFYTDGIMTFYFILIYRMHYWICLAAPMVLLTYHHHK